MAQQTPDEETPASLRRLLDPDRAVRVVDVPTTRLSGTFTRRRLVTAVALAPVLS